MTEKKELPEEDDLHWGFIMALTAGYLDLADLLARKGLVDRAELGAALRFSATGLKDLRHAVHWLEVTATNLEKGRDDPDEAI